MQVERNSVWEISCIDGFKSGKYRVLEHFPKDSLLALFLLHEEAALERPLKISIAEFEKAHDEGRVKESSFPIPFYQLSAEENIPKKHLTKRDYRFSLIEDLISESSLLPDLLLNQRSRLISGHARKLGVSTQTLYRLLNLFWKYGQERNALLPSYRYSGGAGKSRVAGKVKRGTRTQLSTPSLSVPVGVNTTEDDKVKFLKAMKKYGLKGQRSKFSRIYDHMLKEFYSEELILADRQQRYANVPTYRMFLYWVKKLVPKDELIRKQTTQGDFNRNHRGLRGSATDHTEVPGSCFELDATVLDVHVVSEFRRNHVLGRPTVYCVVDKESRMIVGLHVSMEYASWRAGRQALVNSFTSKKTYCARFGLEIEEEDWPCNHIPQRLLCDRGEFICKNAEKLAVPLIGHLSIAPPYRAELKGIVEKRFSILNDKLVHELMGTTRGRQYVRGDKDPRLDAALTLPEITKLLIDAVLEHNSSYFESLAAQSTLLVESDILATPLNYWKVHLEKHRHALNKANEADVRARLLPYEKVSMTSEGIRLNDSMYYECDHPDFESWKVIARGSGSWIMEARIDQDNSSFIYVRLQECEGFTRCSLVHKSANLKEKHQADVMFFEDWKKINKKVFQPKAKSIERHNRRREIVESAKDSANSAPPLSSKVERIRGMKKRRKKEILQRRVSGDVAEDVQPNNDNSTYLKEIGINKAESVVSLLKRKKERNQ
ncbi:hypothetical protein ACJJIU_13670 [Microbulbifer sp. CnH-101-E]|uniref:hypothetical protein n=1 Tax=unclassified Microbulbifer TaxID=2619833 RepID=UPI004039158A